MRGGDRHIVGAVLCHVLRAIGFKLPAQEMEVIGLAAATLLSKYRKMATFDELLERFFFLGKAAVAILLFFVGGPHMVSYLIGWAGAFPLFVVLARRIDNRNIVFVQLYSTGKVAVRWKENIALPLAFQHLLFSQILYLKCCCLFWFTAAVLADEMCVCLPTMPIRTLYVPALLTVVSLNGATRHYCPTAEESVSNLAYNFDPSHHQLARWWYNTPVLYCPRR